MQLIIMTLNQTLQEQNTIDKPHNYHGYLCKTQTDTTHSLYRKSQSACTR